MISSTSSPTHSWFCAVIKRKYTCVAHLFYFIFLNLNQDIALGQDGDWLNITSNHNIEQCTIPSAHFCCSVLQTGPRIWRSWKPENILTFEFCLCVGWNYLLLKLFTPKCHVFNTAGAKNTFTSHNCTFYFPVNMLAVLVMSERWQLIISIV